MSTGLILLKIGSFGRGGGLLTLLLYRPSIFKSSVKMSDSHLTVLWSPTSMKEYKYFFGLDYHGLRLDYSQ
jgi:hypothetical protein